MRSFIPRALLIAGVSITAFTGCLQDKGISATHASPTDTPASSASSAVSRMTLPDFSSLVEQVGPSVVNISVKSQERRRGRSPLNEDDPFFEFFRRFGVPVPNEPGNEAPQFSQGVGSGFIVSPDGYILTNAHVVAGAAEVTVKLTDKREFKAKVVGSDKRTDVALLKIDAKNLPAVRTGNATRAKVGEWVLAVGSPFGFDNTVTTGIISAKARRLEGDSYVTFIQTDVAINPGNSGGPLFNLNGEVIGINSQIYSGTGQFAGISFSIPIDVALKVRDQLLKNGKVSRGKLGVMIQGMDAELAQSFGLDKAQGALISSTEKGGPADRAGLQSGDIITAVDGQEVSESSDLPRIIGEHNPGDSVQIKVWRDKATRSFNIKLAEASEEKEASSKEPGADNSGKLGLSLRELDANEQRRLGVSGGLLVEAASGPAARAGIRQGDVIVSFNNKRVNSVAQIKQLSETAGKQIPVLIQRGEQQQFLLLKLN